MLNNMKHVVFLAVLLFCGTVLADSTSDKLTQIEAETLLLKARERQLDVQASILTKQNEIAAKQNAGNHLAQSPAADDPVVHGIEGLGRDVIATLQLSDGNMVDVRAGDVLSSGMRIVSIAPSSVIVQKGKKQIRLSRYVSRPVASNSNLASSGQIPPLPVVLPRGGVR